MKCKECNRDIEDSKTVGAFYGVCDECYTKEKNNCSNCNDRKMPILDTSKVCYYDEVIKLQAYLKEFTEALESLKNLCN